MGPPNEVQPSRSATRKISDSDGRGGIGRNQSAGLPRRTPFFVTNLGDSVHLDQQGQDASLAALAVSLRDSLNRLGAVLSEMLGEEVRDEYFTVQTTFRGIRKDPVVLRLLFDVWREGGLSLDALIHALFHGTLPDDVEVQQLVEDAMAEADLKAQQALELAKEQGASPVPDQQQAA